MHDGEEHVEEDDDEKPDKHDTYTTSPDFWTLGVCAFHWSSLQMPFGPSPDEEGTKKEKEKKKIKKRINKHILKGKWEADEDALPAEVGGLMKFCKALLTVEPERRLGSDEGGFPKLKAHEFFDGFDWGKLAAGALEPPIKPSKTEMNSPPSNEMDTKKVDAYKGQKAGEDVFQKHFSGSAPPRARAVAASHRATRAARTARGSCPLCRGRGGTRSTRLCPCPLQVGLYSHGADRRVVRRVHGEAGARGAPPFPVGCTGEPSVPAHAPAKDGASHERPPPRRVARRPRRWRRRPTR